MKSGLLAKVSAVRDGAAHIANAGDPIGEIQLCESRDARIVNMHVPQTRNQVLTGRIDYTRIGRCLDA